MKPTIDIHASLADAPDYRIQIGAAESSLSALESSVKVLIKHTKSGLDVAAEYSAKNAGIARELKSLAGQEKDEPLIESALTRFADALLEIERSREIMLSHLGDVFVEPLDQFVKRDVSAVKELKKTFEKSSDNVDSTLDRYLSKRTKDVGVPESAEDVATARTAFHEKSIDYAMELNSFQYKKRADLLENVLAFMYTQYAFYHQGYEFLKDMDPLMREMTAKLNDVRATHDTNRAKDDMDKEVLLNDAKPTYSPMSRDMTARDKTTAATTATTKAGYLVKRGSGKITQVWSRRWFTLRGDYLLYTARGKDESPTVAANLRLCSVKPTDLADRRFCFEVISPMKSVVLQAESDSEMQEWIEVIQAAIARALNTDRPSDHLVRGLTGSKEKLDEESIEADEQFDNASREANGAYTQMVNQIRAMPGNQVCADCGTDAPEWTSLNLGVMLCIECSGIHRSLGVQVSKVRSVTLDKWEPESVDIMLSLGNTKVNTIYEAKLDVTARSRQCATAHSDRATKERWITAKYVNREHVVDDKVAALIQEKSADQRLWDACASSDTVETLQWIAAGGNVDWKHPDHEDMTPLLHSVHTANHTMTYFLLQWNADLKATSCFGANVLHLSVEKMDIKLVALLLKRNVDLNSANSAGKTPLDLAVDMAHPELVTMLRMHQFEIEQSLPARRAKLEEVTAVKTLAAASAEESPRWPSSSGQLYNPPSSESLDDADRNSIKSNNNNNHNNSNNSHINQKTTGNTTSHANYHGSSSSTSNPQYTTESSANSETAQSGFAAGARSTFSTLRRLSPTKLGFGRKQYSSVQQ